ncbi:hypothetical protein PSECIP111951_00522 [Pseudoalteromonas holothuriae]|uniref:PDZ domain-containing protein n=1 Tax=Pseudoalteromonas holothuriae TaxID=2963714 RepID=A0A9W4VMG2_9GAMM|nr:MULTISPECIES: hypothetical protein [unclassified Pseudoalteromonas]CAH9049941.1 hypothetical protein PSECIP111854_00417 [Pseudoalteromonas sp. CIP111854]CAH9052027.1 hypothetical protein PSECIP111951_00522 [Pseudoalteromonas sp. CIP111951]
MNTQYHLIIAKLLASCALIWLLSGCQAKGIINLQSGNLLASQQWQGSNEQFSLPFVWHDGHIIIELAINDSQPLRFALDSAASATVLFETPRSQPMHLNIEGQLNLSEKKINIVNNAKVSVGNIKLSDLTLIHVPINQNPLFDDFDSAYFDGAIGYDLFNHYNITILYSDNTVVFSKPQSNIPLTQSWQQYPLSIHGRLPYVSANISNQTGSTSSYKFVLDTGAPDYIYLNKALAQNIKFPAAVYQSKFENFEGMQQIETGQLEQFNLFFEHFTNMTAHNLPKLKDDKGIGMIGSGLLKNFDIHFNYQQGFVAVRKGKLFDKHSLLDRSGLVLEPHKLGGIIKQIDNASHALKLNLQVGTIVTKINGHTINQNNFDNLRRMLSGDGVSVNLCWQEGSIDQCDDLTLYTRTMTQ